MVEKKSRDVKKRAIIFFNDIVFFVNMCGLKVKLLIYSVLCENWIDYKKSQ